MPAHVIEVGSVYRVVDPSGAPVKNAKGTAVDGGGHHSRKDAVAQAQAINISLKNAGKI